MKRKSMIKTAVAASLCQNLLARDWDEPVRYPNPDIKSLDKRFNKLRLDTPIHRIATGMLWAEGPAWSAVGKYLLWSDIPNNCQKRWLNENGKISMFRKPTGNSNGNTFDFQGRQISCEHLSRSVVRYEHNGEKTILAKSFEGKPLNAPNDAIVHPVDGSIWFTDPGYGSMMNYEGKKRKLQQKESVYRIIPDTGKIIKLTDEVIKPNGICFSADYKKLYVSDTGDHKGKPKTINVWDIQSSMKLTNRRIFANMKLDGVGSGGADGMRCDVEGNVWASAGWGGPGYDGVHIFAPDGKRIGQILLPEMCSNVCFGGPKRNRLFMTASQSVYAVYVETRGAHIT